jgi:hypothetical protein
MVASVQRLAARLLQRLEQRGRDVAARRELRMELAVMMAQFQRRRIRLAPHLRDLALREVTAREGHAGPVAAYARRFVGKRDFDIIALGNRAKRRRGGLLELFEWRLAVGHGAVQAMVAATPVSGSSVPKQR